MGHNIQPDDHHVAGETSIWEYSIIDEQTGDPKDLTGASVEWRLLPAEGRPDGDAILEEADGGVTASVKDATGGLVVVELDAGTTDDLGGRRLWQRLVIDDDAGTRQTYGGGFPVLKR